MKNLKRFLTFAAGVILLVPIFAKTAHADLIYTPTADDFYENRAEDCVYTVISPGAPGIREAGFQDKLFAQPEAKGLFTDPYRNTWAFAGTMKVREGKKEAVRILPDDPAKKAEDQSTPSEKFQWKYTLLAVGILIVVIAGGIVLYIVIIGRGNKKKKRKSK